MFGVRIFVWAISSLCALYGWSASSIPGKVELELAETNSVVLVKGLCFSTGLYLVEVSDGLEEWGSEQFVYAEEGNSFSFIPERADEAAFYRVRGPIPLEGAVLIDPNFSNQTLAIMEVPNAFTVKFMGQKADETGEALLIETIHIDFEDGSTSTISLEELQELKKELEPGQELSPNTETSLASVQEEERQLRDDIYTINTEVRYGSLEVIGADCAWRPRVFSYSLQGNGLYFPPLINDTFLVSEPISNGQYPVEFRIAGIDSDLLVDYEKKMREKLDDFTSLIDPIAIIEDAAQIDKLVDDYQKAIRTIGKVSGINQLLDIWELWPTDDIYSMPIKLSEALDDEKVYFRVFIFVCLFLLSQYRVQELPL